MDIIGIIKLLGGLGLFLFGMSLLGDGLESASGGKLERILEKLTGNIFIAVLLGAVVTGLIQSSSATTVIVVGLVNAKSLKLKNAIGVIMGANIGTTVTGQILRLSDIDGSNLLIAVSKTDHLGPLGRFHRYFNLHAWKTIGSEKYRYDFPWIWYSVHRDVWHGISDGSFEGYAGIREIFATMTNPIVGVLVGAGVTALIQSSSASIGILQAPFSTGQITFSAAFPIIMGQNIGTCITPILASIGASKNAKRSAVVHLSFNVIGTIIFLIVGYSIQGLIGLPFWNHIIDKGDIANFHTFFNVIVTLLFIPFAGLLEKLACKIIRGGNENESSDGVILEKRLLATPVLAIEQGRKSSG